MVGSLFGSSVKVWVRCVWIDRVLKERNVFYTFLYVVGSLFVRLFKFTYYLTENRRYVFRSRKPSTKNHKAALLLSC